METWVEWPQQFNTGVWYITLYIHVYTYEIKPLFRFSNITGLTTLARWEEVLNWIVLNNDSIVLQRADVQLNQIRFLNTEFCNIHTVIFPFISLKLLWSSLCCIKHCRNKWDLAVFSHQWTGTIWLKSVCYTNKRVLIMEIDVMDKHRSQTNDRSLFD